MNTQTPRSNPVMFCAARAAVAALVSTSLLLSGCMTMESVAVPVHADPSVAVHVDDHVRIQTKTGQTLAFKVTRIEPDALAGKNVRVNYADIAGLQVQRMDEVRSAATIGGLALLTGLVVVLSHGIAFTPPAR